LDEVQEWQNLPLEKLYAILYLDALRFNRREDGSELRFASCMKSVCELKFDVALGVNFEGQKEVAD